MEVDVDEPYETRPVRPVAQLATRLGLWAALGLGCLGGLFGLFRPDPEPARPIVQQTADDEIVPGSVAGVAERVVQEWLTATPQEHEAVDALFVDPPELRNGADGGLTVERTTTVAGRRLEEGYWSVTVATDIRETIPPEHDDEQPTTETSTWYVQVAIVGDAASRLAALTTPAVVPAPPAPTSAWRVSDQRAQTPDENEPLTATASGFLAALLTGDGDPSRYVSPGVEVSAIAPAPFAEAELTELAVDDLGNGQTRVLAHVQATTRGGTNRDFSYELIAQQRDGRWEIAQFSGAPTLVIAAPPPETDEQGSNSSTSSTSSTSTTVEETTEDESTEATAEPPVDDPLADAPPGE